MNRKVYNRDAKTEPWYQPELESESESEQPEQPRAFSEPEPKCVPEAGAELEASKFPPAPHPWCARQKDESRTGSASQLRSQKMRAFHEQ